MPAPGNSSGHFCFSHALMIEKIMMKEVPSPDVSHIPTIEDYIGMMATHQNEINTIAAGPDWRSKSRSGEMNQLVAASMEMIEFMGSISRTSFEWWKKGFEPDLQNAKVELVDAYHFYLGHTIATELGRQAYTPDVDFNIDAAVTKLASDFQQGCGFHYESPVENVASQYFMARQVVSSWIKNVHWYPTSFGDPTGAQFFSLVRNYFAPAGEASSNQEVFSAFYSYYAAKGALNIFRQKNGYKQGTYKKIWTADGREDNYVLMTWIDQMAVSRMGVTPGVINAWLEEQYAKVK